MQTMVRLTDTVAHSANMEEVLGALATACAELVRDGEASVLVSEHSGALSVYASTSGAKRDLDEEQIRTGEGWVIDAFETGDPILGVPPEHRSDRWPSIAPRAHELGFRTSNTLPLRYRGEIVGVLDVCDPRMFPLSSLQLELLRTLAIGAGLGVGNRRSYEGQRVVVDQLQAELDTRVDIEQAKGAIMGRLGVDTDLAYEMLVVAAQARNVSVRDLGRLIVAGQVLAESLLPRPRS